jgi:carbon-monoxide dehydrogenase medium subunit
VIPAAVEYVRADSAEEALEALAEPDAKLLAGGQSLIPAMKLRIARPSVVVDIGGLDLGGVRERDGELGIGALATWAELEREELFRRPALRAFAECAAGIGDLQVRNRGTIGGSLAHADPASDMPAVVLALDAELRLRSHDAMRSMAATELILGPFTTSLGERELIVEIAVPTPPPGSGSAYVAVEHPASGFALAGAAALVKPGGERSVAVTGIAAAPFMLEDGDEDALASTDVFGDRFAPAEYRRQLARVLVRRAVEAATRRAEEDS